MRHAFTLIELIVVIAIIAILAALLLPMVGRAQSAAWREDARALLVQVDKGIVLYRDEYRRYPPMMGDASTNNLGFCLSNPAPIVPADQADRDLAKQETGFPNDYLSATLAAERYDAATDWAALTFTDVRDAPLPIYDKRPADNSDPEALIYVHDPDGRTTTGGVDHDIRTHARDGFEELYELWSAGPDGLVDPDYHLHDRDLVENEDNVTVTPHVR